MISFFSLSEKKLISCGEISIIEIMSDTPELYDKRAIKQLTIKHTLMNDHLSLFIQNCVNT